MMLSGPAVVTVGASVISSLGDVSVHPDVVHVMMAVSLWSLLRV
jgi:hypothetical protein